MDHVDGIGVKRAKDIIDEYRSIDNFIEKSPDIKSGKFKIDEDYLKEVNKARYYFLNGPGNIYLPNEVKLVNLDQKKIKELLINKYSYSKTKVEKIIKKIIDA